jgi:hypothetical protein
MDINYYYKMQHKIIKDFNMQKELEKKQSAEDKRLNKMRVKFIGVVFVLVIIFVLV